MGGSQSTQTGSQAPPGQRVGQAASAARTALAAAPGAINQAAQTATALTQSAQGLAQALDPAANTLKLAMANVQRHQGATYGGCDCDSYFGGNDDADPAKGLREYEASLSSKAKEDVIRRLARALKRAGINVDPDGDLDEIVRQLVSQIPNPKNGKTFSNDAKAQEKVCRVIADVLNDEFTPGVTKASEKFIDTSLSAVEMCRSVGEWAHSFAVGVNVEFLAVHASVKNALRSIEILDQIMSEIFGKISRKVDESRDSKLSREVEPLSVVYHRAQNERRKQEELLKNILHVQLAPAAKALEIAMRDESEQNALIKRLGLKPGTSEFADSLAMAISGLGTAASIAQRVHKALKQVGVSVRQYLESAEFSDFQRLLDEKIESGSIKADDLAKFLEAMDTLRASFGQKDDSRFREALSEAEATGGGRRRRHGGADDDEKSSVEKRVERRETEKKVILHDFAGRMTRHYDEMLAAVKAMGPKLGREIPLTDKTDALNETLKRLRDMRSSSQRIELALIGMFMEAEARERKERFVNTLRMVSAACSAIMELEMYRASSSYFARLKAAIDGIEKTIDYFAVVVTKKYGGQVFDEDDIAEVYGGRAHGGAVEDYLPEIARSGLSFGEAVSEFSYYYYVAKVRINLEQTSKELDSYGEKYVELLGDAVASRIYSLGQERKAILDRLTLLNPEVTLGAAAPPFANDAGGRARYAAARKWVNDEYDIKTKFYNALQAVDLYMKAFTAALVKDPDSIRDIKKMIDGTQVIARWFSEQTGDNIWKAFEFMGSVDFAAGAVAAVAGDTAAAAGTHYYDKLAAVNGQAGGSVDRFGIPEIGVECGNEAAANDRADKAKKAASAAIDYFQALKNLVNAFARIGDKFGGRELRTQVFMSPAQIFKVLTDYMKQSAMSINSKGAAPAAAPAALGLAAVQLATGVDVIPAVANAVPPWQVYFGSIEAGVSGNYVIEDNYFVLIIKAMAAKVLTTLGVFDMFERTTPLYDLTPTRIIVGGADDFTDPEVLEGAAELYFRLPRLAEFYRVFLRWDGNDPAVDWRIAMLPELEGVFSGLIRLIFQKAVSPESGDYSDSEMRTLVREVNSIYENFREKHSDRAPQAALSAFVMEINRRYGIIKRKDMQDYMNMIKLTRTGQYGELNDTNYAILPGEGEAEVDRRAPSDRYSMPGDMAAAAAPFANRVGLDHAGAAGLGLGRKMMLREFRAKFEKQFELVTDRSQFGKTSYSLLIKQAELEIHRAQTRDAKFLVATKLIQGTNIVGTDANKAFMFHETVVVGLNLLSSFEAMLRNYSNAVDRMNPRVIENAIMDAIYLNAIGAGGAARVAPAATLASLQGIMRARLPDTADGGAGTIYDRYLISNAVANFAMRSNVPMNATPANVYTFLVAEEAAIAAAALVGPDRPSKITAVNPHDHPGGIGGAVQERYVQALRLAARLITNYGLAMRDYVENLFDLMSGAKSSDSSQSLVEVRMSMTLSTGVQLSFAKFRGVVEKLMVDVKYFFEIFRPFLPAATVNRFEAIGNPGSIFWIEQNLIDRYFRGTDADADATRTLEGLARRASGVYADLLRETNVQLGPLITNAGLVSANAAVRLALIPVAPANEPTRFENYGQTFSEIVFYNAVDDRSRQTGLALTGALAGNNPLGGLIQTQRGAAPPQSAGGAAVVRSLIYDTAAQGMTRYRSLLFAYNQLIARFLASLTDTAGGQRIYLNLINAFANGVASRSVTAPEQNVFPDLAVAGENFGYRGDPKPEAILCQSLAWIIQRMIKNVNPNNQVPDHVVTTLTDVPMYMKEAMRVNLPAFVKYFDLLAQKGDFIKQIMQKTAIRMDRPNQQTISGAGAAVQIRAGGNDRAGAAQAEYPANALLGLQILDAGQTDATMKVRLAAIIDAIAGGSFSLSSSAAETLKELGDTPVYLQTQEGSIDQYNMRYGKMPLMPLSLSLYFLNDLDAAGAGWNDLKLFPGHVLGTPGFKLMYGTRQLIMRSSPVGFEQVPGVKALLEAYNGVSARREQIEASRFLSFVQTTVGALRFLTEARNLKSALSTVNQLFSTGTLVRGAAGAAALNGIENYAEGPPAAGNAAFAVAVPAPDLQSVLNVVESSNQEEEAGRIAGRVGGTSGRGGAGPRELERILNIIDMNVIPINVHALMRDVPLANLYNYEYTFEQMLASMYGEQSSLFTSQGAWPAAIDDAHTRTTRQMLLRLLVNPYLDVTTAMYGSETRDTGSAGYVHRIFRGDNNLGMGRPKFLSDQLFNKVLFGSVYQSRRDFDEAGPAVGIGAARGQGVAAGPMQNALRQLNAILGEIAADRAAFVGAGLVNNGAGLAAQNLAVAAGAVALRDRVYDWIYGTNAAPGGASAHILRWAGAATRLPATVPGPNPRAALTAIAAELDGAGAGAQDFLDLMGVITTLGANKAAIIAAGGFDAAVDALFLTEYNPATAGSVPNLITATLNPATVNGLAVLANAELIAARNAPNAWNSLTARDQTGARASKLTYLKAPAAGAEDNAAVVEVPIDGATKRRLEAIGKERFDTRYIRNIFYITNVVRILRLKLNRELTQNRNVLVASHMSVAAGVTEYGSDPFGPNEDLSSTMNGIPRFSDRDDFV